MTQEEHAIICLILVVLGLILATIVIYNKLNNRINQLNHKFDILHVRQDRLQAEKNDPTEKWQIDNLEDSLSIINNEMSEIKQRLDCISHIDNYGLKSMQDDIQNFKSKFGYVYARLDNIENFYNDVSDDINQLREDFDDRYSFIREEIDTDAARAIKSEMDLENTMNFLKDLAKDIQIQINELKNQMRSAEMDIGDTQEVLNSHAYCLDHLDRRISKLSKKIRKERKAA